MSGLKTFSCRAECRIDVEKFIASAYERKIAITARILPHPLQTLAGQIVDIPDVKAEFETAAELEDLRAVLRHQIDSHVMIESLREQPLGVNTLDRDRSVE